MPEEPTASNSTDETTDEAYPSDGSDKTEEPSQGAPSRSTVPTWRPLVRPYLLRLASKISDQGRKDYSISFPIGRFNILASPLDQDLALIAAEGHSPDQPHRLFLLDAMGLEILIAVAFRKFEKSRETGDTEDWGPVEEGLNFGYRLSHAITIEMRRMTDEGLTGAANELQDARRRLTSLIDEVEKTGGETKSEPKDSPGQECFVYHWDSSGSASDMARRPVEVSRNRPSSAQAQRGAGLKRLALTVLVVILGLILTQLWLNRERELQDFSSEDFPKVPGIEQVVNRSPVLLIIVSERQWNASDRYEKNEAIDSVRMIVEPAGYKRVEFRSRLSANLASWNGGKKVVIKK